MRASLRAIMVCAVFVGALLPWWNLAPEETPGARSGRRCRVDRQCGALLCIRGRCRECGRDQHCRDACQMCTTSYRCVKRKRCCTRQSDCPAGICSWVGSKQAFRGSCVPQCSSSGSCPIGYRCVEGLCERKTSFKPPGTGPGECRIDRDCALGYAGLEYCVSGRCRYCTPGSSPCKGDVCSRCDANFSCQRIPGCCFADSQCVKGVCALTSNDRHGRCVRGCRGDRQCRRGQHCRHGHCLANPRE